MIGDLISRRSLIIRLKNGSVIPFSKMLLNDKHKQILEFEDMVKTQPTSYDTEKVIQQINDAIMPTPEHRHKFCGTVEPEHCVKYENCEDCMAERMIEIVKSGGIAVGQKGDRNETD